MVNSFIQQLLLERFIPSISSDSSGNDNVLDQSGTISVTEEKLGLSQSTRFVSVCLPELPLLMDSCESFLLCRRSHSTFKFYVQVLCIKNWVREKYRLMAKYLEAGHKGCFCMKCSTSQKFLIILNSRGNQTRRKELLCRRVTKSLYLNSDSCLFFGFSSFS